MRDTPPDVVKSERCRSRRKLSVARSGKRQLPRCFAPLLNFVFAALANQEFNTFLSRLEQ